MALTRAIRLRKNQDFQRVRQQGRSIASRLLVLASAPNHLTTTRIGFVVSKRISKRAVDRNYIKRMLSEVIRQYLADLPEGWDIVISAKYPILNARPAEIAQDMRVLFRRARLLSSSPTVNNARDEGSYSHEVQS